MRCAKRRNVQFLENDSSVVNYSKATTHRTISCSLRAKKRLKRENKLFLKRRTSKMSYLFRESTSFQALTTCPHKDHDSESKISNFRKHVGIC